MQLELHVLHSDSHWGSHSLFLLSGLPRLKADSTSELETLVTKRRKPCRAFGAKGGPVHLRPKLGLGPRRLTRGPGYGSSHMLFYIVSTEVFLSSEVTSSFILTLISYSFGEFQVIVGTWFLR